MDRLVDFFTDLLESIGDSANSSPYLLRAAATEIADDDFPTDKIKRDPDECMRTESYLVHLARRNEWVKQMGEYAPISAGGMKLAHVPLFDLSRVGNHVRSEIFTKSVVMLERDESYRAFGGVARDDIETEVEHEHYILVYVPMPDADDLDWIGEHKYPQLNRPLHKERDPYAVFELVFDIEELTLAVPPRWEIEEKLEQQRVERKRIKDQENSDD